MKYSKLLRVICIPAVLAILLPQKTVQAQTLDFAEVPLERFHDEQPIELFGLFSSQTLNIPVPQNWIPGEENWIEIRTRASSLLDPIRSSLTISINGSHVSSFRVREIAQTEQRILLPGSAFTQGNNTLTFTGTLYLPKDEETNCQIWDDPSRWLAIEPGGILHLSFTRRDLSMDLANFPQVFVEPLEGYLADKSKRQMLFVLPEESTQDDLTSLTTMSYVLGSAVDSVYDWRPDIVTEDQFNGNIAANRNIVFIGKAPTQLLDTASKDKDYVALLPSPWGQGNAAMIIGDQNRQDGFSPASVFSDPTRRVLLYGNLAYIDQYPQPTSQPFRNNFSFEDLGYLDRTVRGIGQQNLIYSLYIPYDIDPSLVKLNVGLVHSPDLDVQTSTFTVYLNGFSVAGILPTGQSTTGLPLTVGLPAKRFRPGINFIRIQSDLHVPYSSCERAPESVWVTILNSSTLDITYRNRSPIPSLEHFPQPFSDYPGFSFVIPDQYSKQDLGYISRLAFLIGTSPHPLSQPPRALTAGDFLQHDEDYRNVVLVGLPSQNSATMNANALLPQPFTEDGSALQEGYGVFLPTSEQDASLGLMQIMPSPWVKGGTVLVLTGNNSKGLEWTWDVILNPALRGQFAGNVMVVGSANRSEASGEESDQQNLQTIFQQIADASNIPIVGPLLQKWGQSFLAPALIAVGAALFLAVCILWIVKTGRNKNTIEDTEEREDHE